MANQHWSRWYTDERLGKMTINQLAREHKVVKNAIEAFEMIDAEHPNLIELRAVFWNIEEHIRNLVLPKKKQE